MTLFISTILISCVGLGTAFWYLMNRRQKKKRLELRLLGGRTHLLGEEIALSLESLQNFSNQNLKAQHDDALEALDQLHLLLVERQAHLLNSEDLIHLQNYKISVLKAIFADDIADHLEVPNPAVTAVPPPTTEASSSQKQDRANVEDQLLSKISQLNKGKTAEKKPPEK